MVKKRRLSDSEEEDVKNGRHDDTVIEYECKPTKRKSMKGLLGNGSEAELNGEEKFEEVPKKTVKKEKKNRRIKTEHENGVRESTSGVAVDVFEAVIAAPSSLTDDHLVPLLDHLEDNKDDESSRAKVRERASSLPFLSALLTTYTATRSSLDTRIYDVLHTLESVYKVNVGAMTPLVFGADSKENYEKLRSLGRHLHVHLKPDEVVQRLNGDMLWKTVMCGNRPGETFRHETYDTRFILRHLLSIVKPGSELSSRLFVESNCLALAFASASAADEETRRTGLLLLQAFLGHLNTLTTEDFPAKGLVLYLIRMFKNSIAEEAPRLSHIITHFFARASKLLLQPAHPLFGPVLAFLTFKPSIDLNQVPEQFKLLMSTSTEHWAGEQQWIIDLMAQGMQEKFDYDLLQSRSSLRYVQLLFGSVLSRPETRRAALALFKAVMRTPSASFDCLVRCSFGAWITAAIQNPDRSRWEVIYLGEVYKMMVRGAREWVQTKKPKQAASTRILVDITYKTILRMLEGNEAAGIRLQEEIEDEVSAWSQLLEGDTTSSASDE